MSLRPSSAKRHGTVASDPPSGLLLCRHCRRIVTLNERSTDAQASAAAECPTTSWDTCAHGYGDTKPNPVTTVANVSNCAYDANGNMTSRIIGSDAYTLTYDVENRPKEVVKKNGAGLASFGYDGDGRMVTATVGVTTTYYVGNYFELVNGVTHTYYYHAGKRIAMRQGNTLYWLLTDHLGSTSMVVAATSPLTGELRYRAYGETRNGWGITDTTKYRFTGQREEGTIGLHFYNARWYDAALGRFVQADSIVPQPGNPQALNRYSYVLNNPLKYSDPSGHANDPNAQGGIGAGWDPEWVARFKDAHGGAYPKWQDWFDYQLSLGWPGTGDGGSWTEQDWREYHELRSLLGDALLRQIGAPGGIDVAILGALGAYLYDPWLPIRDESRWLRRRLFPQQQGALQADVDATWVGHVRNWPRGIILGQARGFALGNVVILSIDFPDPWTFYHEYVHVLQYRAWGLATLGNWLMGGQGAGRVDLQAGAVARYYTQRPWLPPMWVILHVEY
jgi:RHS repeat-associated protein